MKPVRSGWTILPPVIIIRYWIVQGTLYMNWVERMHRWLLEALVLCLLYYWLCPELGTSLRVILAFVITHTMSAVFNGHMFAMLTHDLFWFGLYKKKPRFIYYVDKMYARINRKQPEYMKGAVFFGSLTRGVFRETSDLDIRYIAREGFWNAFRTAHFVFLERLHALFSGFPIDAYMFRTEQEVRCKMDVVNEKPVSVFEKGDELRQTLPETIGYDGFRDDFLEMECKTE